MKPKLFVFLLLGQLFAACAASASPIVFNSNSAIGPTNLSYDGADILVTNCTVTIDGQHSFSSLQVATNGIVMHTASPDGLLRFLSHVQNEAQTLSGTNPVTLANSNLVLTSVVVMDGSATITYSNGVDYSLGSLAGNFTSLQRTAASAIPDGSTVLVSYDYASAITNAGLFLAISGDVTINPGGAINALGTGYGSGQGPGNGGQIGSALSGGGGGYGGYGGISSSNSAGGAVYGSTADPLELGSAGGDGNGGSGAAGGGLVKIQTGGTFALNGIINANGQTATNSRSGGGSGGCVRITAQTFTGSGSASANGGGGEPIHGGGGGGGRIAVDYATNSFVGTLTAFGGAGWQRGGAGTVSTRLTGVAGDVVMDNGGIAGALTLAQFTNTPELIVQGKAVAVVSSAQTVANLIVRSNSAFAPFATNNATLTLTSLSNVVVEASANIVLDGRGSGPNSGPGAPFNGIIAGSGAGHGGMGGFGQSGATINSGGFYYGSMNTPNLAGSGGRTINNLPGGSGGGVMRLTVVRDLHVDGRISADATAGTGPGTGGGSGGSIWLTLGGISGSGIISANGGAGGQPSGGGGSGGRISYSFISNSFTGAIQCRGGAGVQYGAAGTIYSKQSTAANGSFLADNGGNKGAPTALDFSSLADVIIAGNTSVTSLLSSITIANLIMGSNSVLNVSSANLVASISGTANFAAGSILSADAISTVSSGAGSSSSGSGGGAHGGYGGKGAVGTAGTAFELASSPSSGGGVGGSIVGPIKGGGAIRLIINGSLNVDGTISANGQPGLTNNSGGAAGGSIWVTTGGISGSGAFSADGGNGFLPASGGGGGGRIALFYTSNSFAGTYSAKGGVGFANGGAGTIYLKSSLNTSPSVTLDNGGLPGSITLLDNATYLNLSILGGSVVTSSFPATVLSSNLTVGAGATLANVGTLTLSGSATVAAGGSISSDGGSTSSSGNGISSPLGSSGAGHAGGGGRGLGALGGVSYGIINFPTTAGSRGGSPSQAGGLGGGALRVSVTGAVVIDGNISANGLSTTNGGGGSGGSIWISAGKISGGGSITADGGPGALPYNGGGGGGRIAIYYTTNAYAGLLSAKGGTGYGNGGAGTVFVKATTANSGYLVVDNGGHVGTNTFLDTSVSLTNLQISGGANLTPSSSGVNLTTLNIASNSTFTGQSSQTINVSGAATISAGGLLSLDGVSFVFGGQANVSGSGGGGNGGYGGNGFAGFGGNASGLANSPTSFGGEGGVTGSPIISGGGALRLIVGGVLTLDGRISANGLNAYSNSSGGAAGGSVWLTAGGFKGLGGISADGGSGHLPAGGGGGGGRIAVQVTGSTNLFSGTLSARGGNGYVVGGAGTIYRASYQSNPATVLVDNGGLPGTNTAVLASGSYDLTVQGGAAATSLNTPNNILVRSNSWVTQLGTFTVGNNVTVEAGGGLNVDGQGTDSGGTGLASTTRAGGGGHGGYGGRHSASAGLAYDAALTPVRMGSAGGNSSGTGSAPYGGRGGGAFHLSANDVVLNGVFSASGKAGDYNSGGGSGGSIWLTARTLSGAGSISARGGQGNGTGGGGGGGRIALELATNVLAGGISACGGMGYEAGGAGTIYLHTNSQPLAELRLDNCSSFGAATPLSQPIGLAQNLKVGNGAVAELQGSLPVLSNVVVLAGGAITGRAVDTNVNFAIEGNLTVQSNATIQVNGEGFAQGSGAGSGSSLSSKGSGGGYGGVGGNSSSGAAGGFAYGSLTVPIDLGSGGGNGLGAPVGGSDGGGALRITVGGQLALDGLISADGADGFQDDSGGGSGGSVWLTAGSLTGAGVISADGGAGELSGGGGGGGGRIALYTPANNFAGQFSATGGPGAFSSSTGTVYYSASLPGFGVVSQTPLGVVSNTLSSARVVFSGPFNPGSVASGDVVLITPAGPLPSSSLTLSEADASTLLVTFPVQHLAGSYQLQTGPGIEDLLGQPMSQVYTGAFTLALPQITGTVRDTNGAPIPGAVLQQTGGAAVSATTDIAGNYTIGVDPGWSGSIVPSFPGLIAAPGLRNYTNQISSILGQDYMMLSSFVPSMTSSRQGNLFGFHWQGIGNINYQAQYSTNLVDWLDYGSVILGTNGPVDLFIPTDTDPVKFFRLKASN